VRYYLQDRIEHDVNDDERTKTLSNLTRNLLSRNDPSIRNVSASPVSSAPSSARKDDDLDALLLASVTAAARAANLCVGTLDQTRPLDSRKRAVDGAATTAAEAVLLSSPYSIEVRAGEGIRDDSPGAYVGQRFGADSKNTWKCAFDYVDGTSLAAIDMPGAMSLGAVCSQMRSVPDLQTFAVVGPSNAAAQINLHAAPERAVMDYLRAVATAQGKQVADLVVSTHSMNDTKRHHALLIKTIRAAVREVIVPELVTVEVPNILSLVGLSHPTVDCMIGTMGFVELAFASALIDLIDTDHSITFRIASVEGPRRRKESTLAPYFDFSASELAEFERHGWSVDQTYTCKDIVPTGCAKAAVVMAVTNCPTLDLQVGPAQTEGYFFGRESETLRLKVDYAV